jgi:hypothetical protein
MCFADFMYCAVVSGIDIFLRESRVNFDNCNQHSLLWGEREAKKMKEKEDDDEEEGCYWNWWWFTKSNFDVMMMMMTMMTFFRRETTKVQLSKEMVGRALIHS